MSSSNRYKSYEDRRIAELENWRIISQIEFDDIHSYERRKNIDPPDFDDIRDYREKRKRLNTIDVDDPRFLRTDFDDI